MLYIHLTLAPYIRSAEELKTKPTQHSVKALREIGIQPDILLCRAERTLPSRTCQKEDRLILYFRNDAVIVCPGCRIYLSVPLELHEERLDQKNYRDVRPGTEAGAGSSDWQEIIQRVKSAEIHGQHRNCRQVYCVSGFV